MSLPLRLAPRDLHPVLAGALVAAVTALAYANSFDGIFLFDDVNSIEENPHIRNLWPFSEAASWPLRHAGETVSGRPVLSVSFALNHFLFGPDPWGYHLVNLLIHTGAALLLFGVVRRTLAAGRGCRDLRAVATPWAATVALLWAVHPLNTESVTYIVQRAESLTGFLLLLTLYASLRGARLQDGGRGPARWLPWFALAVLACALGMGTKEVMFAAPAIVLGYDAVFVEGTYRGALRRRRWLYLFLALTWIVLALCLASWLRDDVNNDLVARSKMDYALTQPGVILFYLRLSLWPWPLNLAHPWSLADTPIEIFPAGAAVGGLLIVTAIGLYRRRWYGFLGAWFFLVLGPSSSFAATMSLLHEHRMYLPLAAVVVLLVAGGHHLLWRGWGARLHPQDRVFLASAAVAAAALVFTLVTHRRNRDYYSETAFWRATSAGGAAGSTPDVNLAVALAGEGRTDEALRTLERAARANPTQPEVHFNLGVAYAQMGRRELAVEHYERAVQLQPTNYRALYNLGGLKAEAGQLKEASGLFLRALGASPGAPHIHNNLGSVLIGLGRLDQAEHHLKLALAARPGLSDAHLNVGRLREARGDLAGAGAAYRKAVALAPRSTGAHLALAQFDLGAGSLRKAVAGFHRTLVLQPDLEDAHFGLGAAYGALGDPVKAVEHLAHTIRLRPEFALAHFHLAVHFASAGHLPQAAARLERATAIEPGFVLAYIHLGDTYLRMGEVGKAGAALDAALAREPDNPAALIRRGAVHQLQGENDRAEASWRRALEIDPDFEEARRRLEALDPP